jgi:NADH:ubiquinone oxidoreductase subunit 3 (subunit A)
MKGTEMDLLLSPPFAFLAYIPVALVLLGLGRMLAGPASPSAMKSSIYGSGEASPTFEAAPGYQPFFLIALFFAVVHLAMLVLGIGSLPMPAAVYLVGLFIALVALILG